ncbi:hypothetical protein VCRA2113O213_360006 [Vibrio crassostreae]|nr:hypothetical protein VCRA2113O213_360006 [Vibrio crassostreae]
MAMGRYTSLVVIVVLSSLATLKDQVVVVLTVVQRESETVVRLKLQRFRI